MNWADWTILAIIALSCLISIKRGFVKEALSVVIWIAAFVIAILFRTPMAGLLVDSIQTPSVREMVAFAILFASTLIVGAMVNYLIGELVKMTGLAGTDRMFGMIFGLTRGVIVVLALLLIVPPIVPVDKDPWWKQSVLIPHFMRFEGWSREAASRVSNHVLNLF